MKTFALNIHDTGTFSQVGVLCVWSHSFFISFTHTLMNCTHEPSNRWAMLSNLAAQKQESLRCLWLWLVWLTHPCFDILMPLRVEKSIKEPRKQLHYWDVSTNFKWWANVKRTGCHLASPNPGVWQQWLSVQYASFCWSCTFSPEGHCHRIRLYICTPVLQEGQDEPVSRNPHGCYLALA